MSQDKISVAVLMGGMSSEHEVSLNSGKGVVEALDRGRYTVIPVTISKDGDWRFGEDAPLSTVDALVRLRDEGVDCVFIALHGPYGEDGRIQGLLDLLGIPYTGSGCAASALAMDKVRCKAVVHAQGIRIAGHVCLQQAAWKADPQAIIDAVEDGLGFPCVIKPACLGSSVGVIIPADKDAFVQGMEAVFEVDGYVMVEEFIRGRELTCGVLDAEPSGNMRALPITEIRPRTAAFFDYAAKYTPGASEEITPAQLTPEVADKVRDMAVHVHEIVGCKGWSRSDFMLDSSGPVWIEVNTVPGLTKTSLYPQAAAAAGIDYASMCSLFIEAALR